MHVVARHESEKERESKREREKREREVLGYLHVVAGDDSVCAGLVNRDS